MNVHRRWAWDSTQPNTPLSVTLGADGAALATVTVNLYRADLAANTAMAIIVLMPGGPGRALHRLRAQSSHF